MSDYISREAAVKIAEKYGLANGSALGRHDGLADCIAIEIEGLPAADVEPVRHGARWIPCSERLPEKAGFYFVATPRGIEIMEFSSGDKRYRETPCFVSEALGKVSGYVTHWQPLPESPKE